MRSRSGSSGLPILEAALLHNAFPNEHLASNCLQTQDLWTYLYIYIEALKCLPQAETRTLRARDAEVLKLRGRHLILVFVVVVLCPKTPKRQAVLRSQASSACSSVHLIRLKRLLRGPKGDEKLRKFASSSTSCSALPRGGRPPPRPDWRPRGRLCSIP